MIDYHVHSSYSGDAPATLADMCARAVEIGLTQIVFTEHIDLNPPDDWTNFSFDYDKWLFEIETAREKYAGRLRILAGAEVDYQPSYHSEIVDFLGDNQFDYVLGAVHYACGIILEDHEHYFSEKSARDAYLPYFEVLYAAARSGLFDTIAHLDICKRYGVLYYGPFDLEEFRPEVEDVLKAMIENGTALEINSSGLRQAPGETYPSIDVLKLYAGLGGKAVKIGSDSHRVEHLGGGMSDALAVISDAGIAAALGV